MKIQIKETVDKAMEALSKQQRGVIILRYGLDSRKRRVLQEIADEYSLTRERIRQIENSALQRLRQDDCVRMLAETIEHLEKALYVCGGVADEDDICLACGLATKAEKNYVYLLLQISSTFTFSPKSESMERYWYTDDQQHEAVTDVMGAMHDIFRKNKNLVVKEKELRDMFDDLAKKHPRKMDSMNTVKFSKEIGKNTRDEWGSRENPEIAMSRLAGFIRIVLREAEGPLHFNEIAKRVSAIKQKPCNPGSCHNELVRSDDFALVGRGLYKLRNDDYKPGSIQDVIISAMKERGPMSKVEVLEYVKSQRQVCPESVTMSLYRKDTFRRNPDGTYYFIG